MDPIEHLAQLLNELPGIGPRQSKRLAYALILKSKHYSDELSRAIADVREGVRNCSLCMRYVSEKHLVHNLCQICRNDSRDPAVLMIVARDVDLQSIERSGFYKGRYFVLGGTVPVLEKSPETFIRLRELKSRMENEFDISEIILAYSQTPEGEHTARLVEEAVRNANMSLTITHLGRGLSTGTELEYSDNETIRNALRNRA